MKKNLLKTAAACLLIFASLMSLAACTAKPAEPSNETPAQTQTPEVTERPSDPEQEAPSATDPQPEEQPTEDETPEEPTVHQASDEELLRLAEQQDPEYPGHTPYLVERVNDADGNVKFKVAFRSESGWLVYAAKEYEASFNDDGGHVTSITQTLSAEDAPQLSSQATDPEALLKLVDNMEICMTGEHDFNFASPADFTSDELYVAYLLLAKPEELEARYNQAEGMYFITWRHIKTVLDRYFKDYHFDITECSNYDATFDGIVTESVSGFGGNRFMKVTEVTPEEGTTTVRFTADFYEDETEQKVLAQKEYAIEFYDDGYYYLSAVEFVVN